MRFLFSNSGFAELGIEAVHFDDGSLLGIASLSWSSGVQFSLGATPPELIGAKNLDPPFQTSAGQGFFAADSDPPVNGNAVDPGEWLAVDFALQGSQTAIDVLNELATGALRIGIRSVGPTAGFVNTPVPAPAALWLFGSGLLALLALRR